jgi:hypothetical protein
MTSALVIRAARFLVRAWLTMAASGSQIFLVTFLPILCCKGWMNTATGMLTLEATADSNLAKSDLAPFPGCGDPAGVPAWKADMLGDSALL